MKQEKLPTKSIEDSLKDLRSKQTPEQKAAIAKFDKNLRKGFVENLNRNVREGYSPK